MPSGDQMRKPRTGDRFEIPARTQGRIIEAALRSERVTPPLVGSVYPAGNDFGESLVYIYNNAGTDLTENQVLGIDRSHWTSASASLEGWKFGQVIRGSTPDAGRHTGSFAVIAEPIEQGAFGRAYVGGSVCAVKVNVIDADHTFADVEDGDYTRLVSGLRGSARILWKESGTGVKWAYVYLVGHGANSPHKVAELFTANGTWTSPEQMTQVTALIVGGGGGGAGGGTGLGIDINLGSGDGTATIGMGGGGGGSGANAILATFHALPSTGMAVTIGGGGGGGAIGTAGADGSQSSLAAQYYTAPTIGTARGTTSTTLIASGGRGGATTTTTVGGAGGNNNAANTTTEYPANRESTQNLYTHHACGSNGEMGSSGGIGAGPIAAVGLGGSGGEPGHNHGDTNTQTNYGRGGEGGAGNAAGSAGQDGCVCIFW